MLRDDVAIYPSDPRVRGDLFRSWVMVSIRGLGRINENGHFQEFVRTLVSCGPWGWARFHGNFWVMGAIAFSKAILPHWPGFPAAVAHLLFGDHLPRGERRGGGGGRLPAKGGDARDASHGGWMDQGRSPGFLQLSEVDRAGVASLIGFLKQQENWQMTLEPGMNQAWTRHILTSSLVQLGALTPIPVRNGDGWTSLIFHTAGMNTWWRFAILMWTAPSQGLIHMP